MFPSRRSLRAFLTMTSTKTNLSLAERFDAVQTTEEKGIQEDVLDQMSFQQLSEVTISFGQTKVGQKYGAVIQSDPRYCRWFLGKYSDSPKMAHRTFVRFLNLWIERKELEQEHGKTAQPKAAAKSRATMEHGKNSPPSPSLGPIDLDLEEDAWDEISGMASEKNAVAVNSQRLDQVEEVLKHVLNQLQILTNRSTEA